MACLGRCHWVSVVLVARSASFVYFFFHMEDHGRSFLEASLFGKTFLKAGSFLGTSL